MDPRRANRYRLSKKLYVLVWDLFFFLIPWIGIFTFIADKDRTLRPLLPYVTGTFMVLFIPLILYMRYMAFHCPYCGKRFKSIGQFLIAPFPPECPHCGMRLNEETEKSR